jgi:hypothetical protein
MDLKSLLLQMLFVALSHQTDGKAMVCSINEDLRVTGITSIDCVTGTASGDDISVGVTLVPKNVGLPLRYYPRDGRI